MEIFVKACTVLILICVFRINVQAQSVRPKPPIEFVIEDNGKLFGSLGSDCVEYPSEEVEIASQESNWGDYLPKNGDTARLIGETYHCYERYGSLLFAFADSHYFVIAEAVRFIGDAAPVEEVEEEQDLIFGLEEEVKLKENTLLEKGDLLQIRKIGRIFSTINSDCIDFPSKEIAEKANEKNWIDYEPLPGDTGRVVSVLEHCYEKEGKLYLVDAGNDYYFVIGTDGISDHVYDFLVPLRLVGKQVELINPKKIFSTIDSRCLDFPSEKIEKASHKNSWGNYYPLEGEIGTVVAVVKHCEEEEYHYGDLLIVDAGNGHFFVVMQSAVKVQE